jgi:hypothetical protein
MAQKERIFADGFRFTLPKAGAPDYVLGRISVKVSDAIEFLQAYEKNDWVNLSVMLGRTGNPYIELDTFEPKKQGVESAPKEEAAAPAKPAAPMGNRKKSQPVAPPTQVSEDDDDLLPF